MIGHAKKAVQRLLAGKRHKLYEERLKAQTLSYPVWLHQVMAREREEILAWEREVRQRGQARLSVSVLSEEAFCGRILGEEQREGDADLWLVTSDAEALTEGAALEAERYFLEHPACMAAYGDEDRYLKPGWSPDLLQSFFYFGNVFAVRKSLAEEIRESLGERRGLWQEDGTCGEETSFRKKLYDILLCCMDRAGEAGHIEKILFLSGEAGEGRNPEKYGDWGREPAYEKIKKGHRYSDVEISGDSGDAPLVSVIIPSKDNPAMLSRCIHSLREQTAYRNMEILVVDNGSSDKNKIRILQMKDQLREEYSFRYFYRPMDFNFSALCNLGAGEAKGEYLLFLNDDIEIAEENWLSVMLSRAAKDHVGAVGAKLLYPDSDKIQHAGIANIHLGPAHKLQFASDGREYYHGYNRCAVNVSAVTGACLLVRRKVFEEAGGFSEKLQVAFNDVEFCFRLLRAGYKNICCNDTFLYHHESVSRGQDADLQKIERLHRERDLLYASCPEMWDRDDYCQEKLVRDILDKGFLAANRFEESRLSGRAQVIQLAKAPDPSWYNESVRMGLEFTGDESAWRTGISGGGDYYIQGWCYAVNIDNSRYEKSILLQAVKSQEEEGLWKVPYEPCYRPDFGEDLPAADRGALCGVSIWISQDALPAGEYRIGCLWEDTCSRQKLYRFSEEKLTVARRPEAGK